MPILLLHLSDIHFTESDDLQQRADPLRRAALAKCPKPDGVILLVSGDIANTGKPTEYARANRFLTALVASLAEAGVPQVDVALIPGNHDCNLEDQVDTRQTLLDSLDTYLSKPIDFSGMNFRALMSVQEDFFRFVAGIYDEPVLSKKLQLYHRREFTILGRKVLIHCFNSAWLSRRHELQAQLFLPPQLLDYETSPDVAISIAMLHHPYNWFNAENGRVVRDFLERQADIVLTGHEHVAGADRVIRASGPNLDYIQAPAFHDLNILDDGFQILNVDLDQQEQPLTKFAWDGHHFTERESTIWALQRNKQRPTNPFLLSDSFSKRLKDMGTGFRHPRCTPPQCDLQLRDLYVYPDLRRNPLDDALGKSKPVKMIDGEHLVDFLKKNPRTMIYGADDSGKSAFSRVLFEDCHQEGFYPVLLNGEDLKGKPSDKSVLKALGNAITTEYEVDSPEPYLQSEIQNRVVIIDDFDKAKLSRDSQITILEILSKRFERILIFASDIFQLQDISRTGEIAPFRSFEKLTIKEFGRFRRQKLIERWHSLGLDNSDDIERLHRKIAFTDKTISTLLGKNVLPHFPVTILTLLQMLESKDTPNTANGAYGYLYETLLKYSLAEVNPKDVDEKITYLSGVGYAMYRQRQPALTEEQMRIVHQEYCDRFDMVRDFSKMMSDLKSAEVLFEAGKVYRFKYPYGYYYSVAKYFQNRSAELRSEIYRLADHIYNDTNANVLIFYVYLTKDTDLIAHLVGNAKRVYATYKPCDLDGDVKFLNNLYKVKPPPLELAYGDVISNRDEDNKRRDEIEESEEKFVNDKDLEDVSYDDKLQELVKLAIAFKTLQLLGQVLRNFTGSLEGPLKLEITRECYALGMRTLQAILGFCSSDIPAMRQYLGSLIAERTGITDKQELADKTDDAIIWVASAAAFGSVKRISYAVGHVDLTNTYGKLLAANKDLATAVIDATIKLDHFERVPEKEFKDLEVKVVKNFFATRVIRDLVADFLYLYDVDFRTMQMLGSQWGITVSMPKYLANRLKK